jgi:hypothetical protein
MKKTKNILKKRKIPVLNVFTDNPEEDIDENILIKHEGFNQALFNEVILAINEGIKSKRKSVTLYSLYGSDYIIDLSRNNWRPSLESALKYFESNEQYETCGLCKKLLEKI